MIEVDHVGLWTEVSHFLMGASKLDMIFCLCFFFILFYFSFLLQDVQLPVYVVGNG